MPKYFRLAAILLCVLVTSPAYATTLASAGDIIGTIKYYTVKKQDNLYNIARKFDIGIVELLAANPGVDPWEPKVGTKLTITNMHILPPVREGVVLNLSELRLFYFTEGLVMTFPIGIGREGWETPIGETFIARKRKDPTWTPPASIREENPDLPDVIPAGPDNPLGQYALSLDWPSYAIHGTNRPYGVGKRSSHGCIRLYPEDIEALFNSVPVNTPVTVIDTPYKLGWRNDVLYLEVTPTQIQTDDLAESRIPRVVNIPEIYDAIRNIAGDAEINWHEVDETVARRNGLPAAIGKLGFGNYSLPWLSEK